MTLREILMEAVSQAQTPISDPELIRYINRALRDLTYKYDTAKIIEDQIIVCEDPHATYPLEANIGIKRVKDSCGYYFTQFKSDTNGILFKYKDIYTVSLYKDHPRISSFSDTIIINPSYHMTIAKYVAHLSTKTSNSGFSALLLKEYAEDIALTNASLKKAENKHKTVFAPKFR